MECQERIYSLHTGQMQDIGRRGNAGGDNIAKRNLKFSLFRGAGIEGSLEVMGNMLLRGREGWYESERLV